jgi:ABC-type multidrug transport system fused ATPase/permease subunit
MSLRQVYGPVLRPYRRLLLGIAAISIVVGFVEVFMLVLIAQVGVAIARGRQKVEFSKLRHVGIYGAISVNQLVALGVAIVLLRFSLQLLSTWYSARASAYVMRRARRETFSDFIEASWSLKSRERTGRLQDILTTFILRLNSSVSTVALSLSAGFAAVTLLVSAFILSPLAAAGIVLTLGLLLLLLRPLSKVSRRLGAEAAQAGIDYAVTVNEVVGLSRDIQVFGVEEQVTRRHERLVDMVTRIQVRARLAGGLGTSLYQAVALVVVFAAMGLVSNLQPGKFATLSAVVLIFVRASNYGQQLQNVVQTLHENVPFVEGLSETRKRLKGSVLDRTGDELKRIGTLEFRHVDFSYNPERPALADVSFTIERGDTVGIVGPSGAGKSTLVQLLLRLRDPEAGEFMIDGRDAREYAQSEWPKHFAFVPQEPVLLHGTVMENIRFMREIDEETVRWSATLAQIHNEIVSLPQGYDTLVGERGSMLSGGQRQRITLARALASRPDVLILDEPTSALDMLSESLVQQALTELTGRMTLIIVAHRLSTLSACSRIMVFGDGRLQGFDSARELEDSNPFYREAVELSQLLP